MSHLSSLLESLAKGPSKSEPAEQREQYQSWLDAYRARSWDPDQEAYEPAHFASVGVV